MPRRWVFYIIFLFLLAGIGGWWFWSLGNSGQSESISIGTLRDTFTRFSERLHLALQPQQAPALYGEYVVRRLGALKRLIDDGRSGLAYQDLSALEEDIIAKTTLSKGATYRPILRQRLTEFLQLLRLVGPSSPLYRLKQRLEDVRMGLVPPDTLESLTVRLESIDARLDEASMLIDNAALDETKTMLDAAGQGLINVRKDLEHVAKTESPDRQAVVRAQFETLVSRETGLRTRLTTVLFPPVLNTTSSHSL